MMNDQDTNHVEDSEDARVQDANHEGDISDAPPEGHDLKSDPANGSSEPGTSSVEPRDDRSEDEQDTFPRDYVEKLRDENARYRQRAQKTDELSRRVHRLLVERTGRLADPDDLPFDESFLDDEDALNTAIEDLVARKPHLAARKVSGNVGQGVPDGSSVDLATILRNAAS